jgi:hypothetical protein
VALLVAERAGSVRVTTFPETVYLAVPLGEVVQPVRVAENVEDATAAIAAIHPVFPAPDALTYRVPLVLR